MRLYALTAVDEEFWEKQPDVAMRCVHALATEAIEIRHQFAALARQREQAHRFDELAAKVANSVRSRFWEADGIRDDVLPMLHPPDRFVAEAINYTLTVLGRAPSDPVAVAAFTDACQLVVDGWDARHEDANDYGSTETRLETLHLLEQFCMRTSDEQASQVLGPMLRAVDDHPDQVYGFVQGLTQIEDVRPNTRHYWQLWQLFADQVKKAKWIGQVERTHHPGRELLAAVFLTLFWKKGVRHWRSVEGYSDRVHASSMHFHLRVSCSTAIWPSSITSGSDRFLKPLFASLVGCVRVTRTRWSRTRNPCSFLKFSFNDMCMGDLRN